MRTETGRTDRPNESRNCRPAAAAPSPGINHAKKKRGVPDAMSGTSIRSVCGILCGQRKSAKPHRFQKLQKSKENTRNPKISGVYLELLGGFEPPPSSLPLVFLPCSSVLKCPEKSLFSMAFRFSLLGMTATVLMRLESLVAKK